jgi:uncharacterized protein
MTNQALPSLSWLEKLKASPLWVRVAPFVIFLLLTGLQGRFGESSRYWIYGLKILAGAGLVCALWTSIPEMRWNWSADAWIAGVGVFLIWIGMDSIMASMPNLPPVHRLPGKGEPWNPHVQFGDATLAAWFFILVRIIGSGLIVPPLEEVFYRSFIYRFIIQSEFTTVPLNRFHPAAFFITSALFAVEHQEWLAGLLCGMIYQAVVLRRGRLGDAIAAHTITNILLGLYVAGCGAWKYW